MITPYKTIISTPNDTIDLTTLTTVKQEIGITSGEHDAVLARLITEQSAAAARYCKRIFAQETLIDSFRLGCPEKAIILSRMPVASISTVVEDDEALTADHYEFNAYTGFVWRLDGSDERQNWEAAKIVVTFVAGYELLATLPEDIERAVIIMIKNAWFSRTRDPLVKSEDIPGVMSQSYWVGDSTGGSGIPAEAVALLDPHRQFAIC